MASTSVDRMAGLVKWQNTPRFRQRAAFPNVLAEVSITMAAPERAAICFICSASVNPSKSGISLSSRISLKGTWPRAASSNLRSATQPSGAISGRTPNSSTISDIKGRLV